MTTKKSDEAQENGHTNGYQPLHKEQISESVSDSVSTQIYMPPAEKHHHHHHHHNHLHLHINKEVVLLNTFDSFICIFVINPCIIGVWRGTWELMEYSYHKYFPPWHSAALGIFIHIVFVILQNIFNDLIKNTNISPTARVIKVFLIRLYVYAFAITCVMTWSSMWQILDEVLGVSKNENNVAMKEGSEKIVFVTLGSLFILVLLRGVYNCLSSPFFVCFDREDIIFKIPTRFKTQLCIPPLKDVEVVIVKKKLTMRGSSAGLPGSLKTQHSSHYTILSILDHFFSSIIVAPLVVGYWRSVWELMGIYVYPDDILFSAWVSTAIGLIGHLVFMLLQHSLEKCLHPDQNRILFYVLSRLYTACFAFICVNGWRGPWQLLELLTSNMAIELIAPLLTVLAILILGFIKALRNVSATPFAIATDSAEGYFVVLTMFRLRLNEKASLYILDCLFSVLVIGTLVVFVWRGCWAMIDILLFPEDFVWSSWGSLIVGYSVVAIAFLLQPFMKWLCDRITGIPRILAADLFLILSLIGTINVWRGIWNLLNIYLLPDNLELSCWITHSVCLIVLILLGCSNSLLVRGVYIDAEEPAGKCVVFPCYYLRLIFQEQKEKKLQKEMSNLEMDCTKSCENNHVLTMSNDVIAANHKESG